MIRGLTSDYVSISLLRQSLYLLIISVTNFSCTTLKMAYESSYFFVPSVPFNLSCIPLSLVLYINVSPFSFKIDGLWLITVSTCLVSLRYSTPGQMASSLKVASLIGSGVRPLVVCFDLYVLTSFFNILHYRFTPKAKQSRTNPFKQQAFVKKAHTHFAILWRVNGPKGSIRS